MPLVGFKVSGIGRVAAALNAKSIKGRVKSRLQVGYSAAYAGKVHEDLATPHANGQAKFLEAPARRYAKQMRDDIRRTLLARRSLDEALLKAGKFLLAESRKLVPVDTGFLRDSGFVEVG